MIIIPNLIQHGYQLDERFMTDRDGLLWYEGIETKTNSLIWCIESSPDKKEKLAVRKTQITERQRIKSQIVNEFEINDKVYLIFTITDIKNSYIPILLNLLISLVGSVIITLLSNNLPDLLNPFEGFEQVFASTSIPKNLLRVGLGLFRFLFWNQVIFSVINCIGRIHAFFKEPLEDDLKEITAFIIMLAAPILLLLYVNWQLR